MKCARCNRPMAAPAATVQTRAGRTGYGPKCAAAMGILPSKASKPATRRVAVKAERDERQADWVMEATA